MQGDMAFDQWNKDWTSVEDALKEYLKAVPEVLKDFDIDVAAEIDDEPH